MHAKLNPLPNVTDGIQVVNSPMNTIGGKEAALANVIDAGQDGIALRGAATKRISPPEQTISEVG